MFFGVITKCLKNRAVSLFICISLVFSTVAVTKVSADEPTKYLEGDKSASFVLENIDYTDIKGTQPWSAPAIYETGALNIMKGYGSRVFAKDDVVTREQALSIALRLAGKENDAKLAAEELNNARTEDDKIKEPFLYWSLGYLKIASDIGLIAEQEYADAAASNGRLGFEGQVPAQRQEMAYWIAKALALTPEYKEQAILNNFKDWKQCDAEKIAYIEATLQNRIMNGDGNGSFLPKGSLTREQAAQISKNAESYILPAMQLTKTVGTIENMLPATKIKNGEKINSVDFYVRNIDGSLSQISSGFTANSWDYQTGELNGTDQDSNNTDIVVYKEGNVGGAGYLSVGDRIEYIYDVNSVVKYINVVSSNLNTEYLVGQLKVIDTKTSTVTVDTFFRSDTSDIDMTQQYAVLNSSDAMKQTYPYSKDANFISDGINVAPTQLVKNDLVIVTVVNDTITKVQKYNPVYRPGASGVISGTVQENNPSLGYITLYGQDGTGVGVNPITSDILRTYDYLSVNGVEVYRDHEEAKASDIEPGDTVFLRLNSAGKVTQISAASNYSIKYGTVLTLKDSSIGIGFSDGTEQSISTDDDTRWFGIDGEYGKDNVKEGDNVMLTLNISPVGTTVIEVRTSDIYSIVNNTYKASFESFQGDTNNIFISDVKTLAKDSFIWTSDTGIKKVPISKGCKIYVDGVLVSIEDLSQVNQYDTTYVVTKSDFGTKEKAIVISVNTQQSSNMPIYNDSLLKLDTLNDSLTLTNSQISLPCKDETIIIRDGRLVSFSTLKTDDALCVATGYYKGTKGSYAALIIAGEAVDTDYFEIYRGRIEEIEDGTSFTVKSYSQLEDNKFTYYNTEKTFDISAKTRLVGDSGLISMRDFTTSGTSSYKDASVYIVSKDGEAVYISTAPYKDMYCYKAEVTKATDSAIELKNGRIFNSSTYEWSESDVSKVNILESTIIIKGEKIINPDGLDKGDQIKLLKSTNTTTGDAYIVVVEE